jgi:hypothetical protein
MMLLRETITVYCENLRKIHCHVIVTIDGVWIGNRIYWPLTHVTTNNYDSSTELPTLNITVTTGHIKYSQFYKPLLRSGFQLRTFLFIWVPELFSASSDSFSLLATPTLNYLRITTRSQSQGQSCLVLH